MFSKQEMEKRILAFDVLENRILIWEKYAKEVFEDYEVDYLISVFANRLAMPTITCMQHCIRGYITACIFNSISMVQQDVIYVLLAVFYPEEYALTGV